MRLFNVNQFLLFSKQKSIMWFHFHHMILYRSRRCPHCQSNGYWRLRSNATTTVLSEKGASIMLAGITFFCACTVSILWSSWPVVAPLNGIYRVGGNLNQRLASASNLIKLSAHITCVTLLREIQILYIIQIWIPNHPIFSYYGTQYKISIHIDPFIGAKFDVEIVRWYTNSFWFEWSNRF